MSIHVIFLALHFLMLVVFAISCQNYILHLLVLHIILKYDILFVSETSLTDFMSSEQLLYDANDYALVRYDKGGERAGGSVCVFIMCNLCYNIVKILMEFS